MNYWTDVAAIVSGTLLVVLVPFALVKYARQDARGLKALLWLAVPAVLVLLAVFVWRELFKSY